MAKFNYDVIYVNTDRDVVTVESFPRKDLAQNYIRNYRRKCTSILDGLKRQLDWKRVVVIEDNDFVIQKKRKGFLRDFNEFDIFECTEQSRFENCPWAGKGSLIWFDDKYELWHTDSFSYRKGEEGFFLVDINARRK